MAWKFRKRVTVFPGFRINLSKSGVSATVGIRGANVNFGQNGVFVNTGLPGTGIYDRKKIVDIPESTKDKPAITPEPDQCIPPSPTEPTEIKSFVPELLTSEGFFGLKESIVSAQQQKNNLKNESDAAGTKQFFSVLLLGVSYLLIVGFFVKWFKDNYKACKQDAIEARKIYENFKLEIDFNLDREMLNEYIAAENNFDLFLSP